MSTTNTQHNGKFRINSYSSTHNIVCIKCKGSHYMQKCDDFLKRNATERVMLVKTLKLCMNCLRKGHVVKDCKSSKCKNCTKSHNTLLHENCSQQVPISETVNNSRIAVTRSEYLETVTNCSTKLSYSQQTLLPVAEIFILDTQGRRHIARALLDSVSQSSFITKISLKN